MKAGYTLCLNGNARILKEAILYYKDLMDLVETGDASVEELETAVADGLAVSEDVIDEAVDGVLDFVLSCEKHAKANKRGMETPSERTNLSIAERSVVLLKNRGGVLPVGADKRVAVIGQCAKEEFGDSAIDYIQRHSSRFIGYEDGYDLHQSQNRLLVTSAKELAKRADVIILFLGVGKQREQTLSKTKCVTVGKLEETHCCRCNGQRAFGYAL